MQANHGLGGKTANAIQIQRGGDVIFYAAVALSSNEK